MGNSPLTGEFPAQRANNAEMLPFDDVIMKEIARVAHVAQIAQTSVADPSIPTKWIVSTFLDPYQIGCRKKIRLLFNRVQIFNDIATDIISRGKMEHGGKMEHLVFWKKSGWCGSIFTSFWFLSSASAASHIEIKLAIDHVLSISQKRNFTRLINQLTRVLTSIALTN